MTTSKRLKALPGLGNPSFRWDTMKDREVFSRAQRAVERGISRILIRSR